MDIDFYYCIYSKFSLGPISTIIDICWGRGLYLNVPKERTNML